MVESLFSQLMREEKERVTSTVAMVEKTPYAMVFAAYVILWLPWFFSILPFIMVAWYVDLLITTFSGVNQNLFEPPKSKSDRLFNVVGAHLLVALLVPVGVVLIFFWPD